MEKTRVTGLADVVAVEVAVVVPVLQAPKSAESAKTSASTITTRAFSFHNFVFFISPPFQPKFSKCSIVFYYEYLAYWFISSPPESYYKKLFDLIAVFNINNNILAPARENDGRFTVANDYNVFSTKIASPKVGDKS